MHFSDSVTISPDQERLLVHGESALTDAELLELALSMVLGRSASRLSNKLIGQFGSFSAVFAARETRLTRAGFTRSEVASLKLFSAAALRFARDKIPRNMPIVGCWSDVIEYCRVAMAHEVVEQLRILFLDKKNRLIADEVQQVGTVDHMSVYPREVIRRSLELSATALILVHNHLSGDPAPSAADVRLTREIAEIAKPMGITVHDHIIIGKTAHVSLKALRFLS